MKFYVRYKKRPIKNNDKYKFTQYIYVIYNITDI